MKKRLDQTYEMNEEVTDEEYEDEQRENTDEVPDPNDNIVEEQPMSIVSEDEDDDDDEEEEEVEEEVETVVAEEVVEPRKKKKVRHITPRPQIQTDIERKRYTKQPLHYNYIPDEMIPDLLKLIDSEISRWHHEHIQDDGKPKKKMGFFEALFEDKNAKFKREYKLSLEAQAEYDREQAEKYRRFVQNRGNM